MSIGEDLRKVLLAGIGALAVTAEKSKEMVDAFVAKGELTVEQGKVLNEELKRNVSDSIHQVTEKKAPASSSVLDQVEELTPAQLELLKKKLAEMEKQQDDEGEKA